MKKILSIMLSLVMVVTMLPTFAISAFADDEPSFVGPNDSDHAYLDIHSNGEDYSFYFMGSMGDAKIDGVCYDLATNTLTLDDYNEPSTIIDASEMGSDFKISVNGENHIKAINVFADRYMGSLTITGEGSISINENKDYDDVPLFLDANETESILTVEDTVKLSVCANDEDVSVKVLNSNSEESIVCAMTEYRISDWEESSSQNRWVNAHDTQMNTFWAVKDSPCYATLCWDEFAQNSVYYEFVLVNKNIDGKEIVFADPVVDDMGNPNIIPSGNIDTSNSITACQIMNNYERQAVEKADDETEYALTEYTLEEDGVTEGPFWDVYKVIHDEDLGPFFCLVSEKLTENPEEYTPIVETINNNYKYIEGDFANFENEGPSESDFTFSANVRGSEITYHNGDNLYIEEGKTELISFEVFDDNDVPYVPAWYSIDMAEQGFEIAPEPVVIDDIYYASITNNAKIENSGTLIINAFSAEKFADPAFDFAITEPDATFNLNIVSVGEYAGVAMVEGKQYPEGSTISINPGETIKMYYDVPNYPGFAIHTINPEPLMEAGFSFEQAFDEEEMPYAIITAGENLAPGTKADIPLSIKRFEDCMNNDFNFEITPSVYDYAVTLEVADNNNTPCEHFYVESGVVIAPTCEKDGVMAYTCNLCGNLTTDGIPATGHKYKTTTTTKATLTADGIKETKCTVCGNVKSTATIKKVSNIKLSATSYVYDGKVKSPTLTVKDSAGKALVKGTDYTVTVPTGRKNVGKYTYKITFKGNYSGTKSLSFVINPKNTSISKLTATKGGFKATIKKYTTQTTGYQIRYSTKSNMSGAKTVTIAKNSTTSKSVTGLSKGKKYYVQIRTFKTVNGTKYYSAWSGSKTVTTKK